MKYFIPTTNGLRVYDDGIQQCWVAWFCEGSWYNEFTGSEKECIDYINNREDKENYQLRYTEFD